MNFKRLFLFLIIAVAFAFLLSSCGEDEVTAGVNSEESHLDSLPAGLDFNGETVKIIHWDNSFVNRELTADVEETDNFDLSVLERNRTVEERLGIKLEFEAGEIAPEYFMPMVQEDILAGTADYDIISGVQCQTGPLCVNGCYRDLSAEKYIDLSKSYWNNDYINELKIGSSGLYMLGGDISLTTTAWSSMMLYNRNSYEEYIGSCDKFYDEIINGDWTLQSFFDKCRSAYVDLNSNGVVDQDDYFGLGIMVNSSIVDMFVFSSGVNYSKRDANNYPILDVFNDKTLNFCDIFVDNLKNNDGIWAYGVDEKSFNFIRSLFEATTVDAISTITVNDDDVGVIPYPKLSKNDNKYHSWISDNTLVYSVPATIEKSRVEMVCAALECMASETRRICIPAYYETTLREKYTRDAQSRTMLDLIHDGATSDFVSIYSESLAGIGTFMRKVVTIGDKDVKANFSVLADEAGAKLNALISEYEKNTSTEHVTDTVSESQATAALASDDYSPKNKIAKNWDTFGVKYRNSGVLLNNDLSDLYSYDYNADGAIEVKSPPSSLKGGQFPTSAIQSKAKYDLDGLSVGFRTDDGFCFNNVGYSASVSFVWSEEPITNMPNYTDQIATNGLREAVPSGSHALSVIFVGTSETEGNVSDMLYIVLHDGTDEAPELDRRVGYRWAINRAIDLSEGIDISVSPDDVLGYVVTVNGTDYREGKRGKETLPIDLTPLKGVKSGHICFGVESTGSDEFANFTLYSINGHTPKDVDGQ